jgi:hypothetical protein
VPALATIVNGVVMVGRMWVGESAVSTMLCICPVADGDYDEFSCLG